MGILSAERGWQPVTLELAFGSRSVRVREGGGPRMGKGWILLVRKPKRPEKTVEGEGQTNMDGEGKQNSRTKRNGFLREWKPYSFFR